MVTLHLTGRQLDATTQSGGSDLLPVELVARDLTGFGNTQSILKDLVLISWERSERPAWPPYVNISVDVAIATARMAEGTGDLRLYGPHWWKVKEEEEQRRAKEAARQKREEEARRADPAKRGLV